MELGMETDGILMDHHFHHQSSDQQHQVVVHQPQSETNHMETTSFEEQLAAALGEDFHYPLSGESETSSPPLDFDYANLLEPYSPPQLDINNSNNNSNSNSNNSNSNMLSSNTMQASAGLVGGLQHGGHDDQKKDDVEERSESEKQKVKEVAARSSTKRKRQPNQVQDHILAERKRRELLSQQFIALSAIVPGLKKTDKTSVLGEAIKYMKQLKEKVNVFEDVAAKRTVESVLVVKKSQLLLDHDDDDDENGSSSCTTSTDDNHDTTRPTGGRGGGGGGGGGSGDSEIHSLPEIELKVSDKTLLLRVYCEKQRGVMAKLFQEVEKNPGMTVVGCNTIPFGTLALDITILVEMEKAFDKNVKDFVRTLRSALLE